MRNHSDICISNINRLHLVLVIRSYFDNNLDYQSKSRKNPVQIKITSQVPNLLIIFKTKFFIHHIQQGIYKFWLFILLFIYVIYWYWKRRLRICTAVFAEKLFYPWLQGCWWRGVRENEGGLRKRNHGKIIEILLKNYWKIIEICG